MGLKTKIWGNLGLIFCNFLAFLTTNFLHQFYMLILPFLLYLIAKSGVKRTIPCSHGRTISIVTYDIKYLSVSESNII